MKGGRSGTNYLYEDDDNVEDYNWKRGDYKSWEEYFCNYLKKYKSGLTQETPNIFMLVTHGKWLRDYFRYLDLKYIKTESDSDSKIGKIDWNEKLKTHYKEKIKNGRIIKVEYTIEIDRTSYDIHIYFMRHKNILCKCKG